MQHTLSADKLMSLEQYAAKRPAFRADVMAHKRDRAVAIGPHATLYFEDLLTMQYQVQEMLRIEHISDPGGIARQERFRAERRSVRGSGRHSTASSGRRRPRCSPSIIQGAIT